MQQAALFFRRLSAAVRLDESDREALDRLGARQVPVPAGNDLIVEGEPIRQVVILERGWACRYVLLEDGRRQILQLLVPGDHVGESGAVFAHADHSIATLTPARVLVFPVEALRALASRHVRLRVALEWSKFRDRSMIHARLIDIGRRSASQSMAHLILELYHRLRLVGAAGENCFALPLTQETLADALGLTMVHVNRTLRQLRADGLVDLKNGLLTIRDRERLTELAGFDPSYLHHAPVSPSATSGLGDESDAATGAPQRTDRAV